MQRVLAQLQYSNSEEKLITLRFSLQQLQSNLDDLSQRAQEFALHR